METFGKAIVRLAEEEFVGRERKLAAFKNRLRQTPGTGGILNVYGTGGIGKTELLVRFQAEAEQAGALFLRIDLRETMGQPALFMQAVIGLSGINQVDAMTGRDPRQLAEALNAAAGGGKLILALDQYEAAGSVDQWLREDFLPLLRSDTILVIAGRHPLGGSWMLSSVWRKLIQPLPLDGLTRDEVKSYLERRGIMDERRVDRLWLATAGHPLSLALLAEEAAFKEEGATEGDVIGSFEELLQSWLQEVPGETLRELVYAAAVPRYFDQDLLRSMLGTGTPFSDAAFDGLLKLSFVRRAGRGWEMHELARSMISRCLRERQPDTFGQYRSRAAEVLSARIRAKADTGDEPATEVHELIGLTGNPILRAHFRLSRNSKNYWEAARPETLEEARQYIAQRRAACGPYRISCSDSETGCIFQYEISAEESLYRFEGWEPEALLPFGGDALRLLRNPEGEVVGLAAMLPIRPDTAEYLLGHPVSGPYFKARPEELKWGTENGEPAARFVFAVDVIDPEQIELRSDTVNLMMEHILAGTLLIASPPALSFYLDSHQSMGFTLVTGLPETHRFGGRTKAAVYRLDTRGRRWSAYLDQIADYRNPVNNGRTTAAEEEAKQPDRTCFGFTPREWEVADVLATGASNKEIAARLFISEAAVKKHINAMLQKTGFRNRTQIAMAILGSEQSGFK